jgi:hypothetical protein
MPKYYAYHGAPPIDMPSIGGTISEQWEGSMQNAMAKKQKDRDLELQLRMAGAVPEEDYIKNPIYQDPEVKKQTKVIPIAKKNWYIVPSQQEILQQKTAQRTFEDYESPEQKRSAESKYSIELEQAKRRNEKPPVDVEAQSYAREKGKQRVDKTEEIYKTVEENKYIRQNLDNVEKALEKVDPSWMGTVKEKYLQVRDPNNPLLADFQLIRTFATDETLLQSMKLKGAISDREIQMLKDAAAGSKIATRPQLKAIIEKARRNIEQSESAKIKSFKKNFGEDPTQWDDLGVPKSPLMPDIQNQEIAVNSIEEANNLPTGTRFILNGRKGTVQ